MVEKLITLVDALIPGDADSDTTGSNNTGLDNTGSNITGSVNTGLCAFPKASDVGVHGILAWRLRELEGAQAYDQLLQAIGDCSDDTVLTHLQQNHPDLFAAVRMIVYLAYYEQPAVIQIIRDMGFIYNDAPQPLGYELEPFDPAIDRPDVTGGYKLTSLFDQASDNAS